MEHKDDTDWSPLQFNLKWIFFATCQCAMFFAVVRLTGLEAVFPLIMLALVIWLSIACIRLVRLSGRQ